MSGARRHVYALGTTYASGAFLAIPPESYSIPRISAILRGDVRPRRPVVLTHSAGRGTPGTVVETEVLFLFAVRKSVTAEWTRAGMTGWQPYPVVIVDKSKKKHSDYDGIAIVGRSGPVTYEGSPYRRYDMPGGTFHFRTGLRCDPPGWSDDDLSMSSDSGKGWIFCSSRFRELNERLRVSQFEFTDVDDIRNEEDCLEDAERFST